MRNIIVLAVMAVCFMGNLWAQKFIATPDGLKDSSNLEKEYIVILFEGKTSTELYDITNKFCQKQYVSPKNAIQGDIKNEFLKIKTYCNDFILLQKGMFSEPYYANITFSSNFSFKDGKVKFEVSDINMKIWSGDQDVYYRSPGGLTWCIFGSNGKPKGDLNIQYQHYFNKYITDYTAFVNNSEKEKDNW